MVTGSTGLIGSRAVKVLQREHEVFGVSHETLELADYGSVKKVFDAFRPEYVIHCAANANPEECEADHDMAIRCNVIAVRNLASLCADYDCGMIFCSSDQVYRYRELPEQIREYHEAKGECFYGVTKLLAEREVLDKVKKHFIARLCWQYGLLEGGMPGKPRRAGIVDMAILAYRNKTPVTVIRGARHHVSNIYDTVDVFRAMLGGALPYGIYNVASENKLTAREIYEAVFRRLGASEEEIASLITEVDGDPITQAPESYYLKLCGYHMPTFEEGLDRFFREAKIDTEWGK